MKMRWALGAVILAAAAGAVTALGDTLSPAASLSEGIQADLSATADFLVRLRVIHPVLALAAAYLAASIALPAFHRKQKYAIWVLGAIATAVLAGAANILLSAPVWLQLIHLLIADVLWIALVLLGSEMRTNSIEIPRATPISPENTLFARE